MNKQTLLTTIAERTGSTQVNVLNVLDALKAVISEELAANNEVTIYNLVKFKKVHRAARAGRNPQTGAPLTIAARDAVTAKVLAPISKV